MDDLTRLRLQSGDKLKTARQHLAEQILSRTATGNRVPTAISELALIRYDGPTEPASYLHTPSLCLIAQGAKRVLLGNEEYRYDIDRYLITSVGLPVVTQICDASLERPFLSVTLELNLGIVSQLLLDADLPQPRERQSGRGMAISQVSARLVDSFVRLIELLDEPDDIPILGSMIQREILYRLLVGPQGHRLRQIVSAGSHSHQIARAIDWLKENYQHQLRVESLANYAGMSPSTFHHHFRALTAMSPLQFQKWLRLNEARRLMLTENTDATTAGYKVGYESPSQFNREYSRLFGAPPMRDIKRLGRNTRQSSAQT